MAKDQSLLGLLKGFTRDDSMENDGGLPLHSGEDDLFPSDTGGAMSPTEEASSLGFGVSLPGERNQESNNAPDITESREEHFSKETGRFMDPETGQFEPGSPPPDLDASTDRYRGKDGQFKKQSADLFDEPEEVKSGSLEPRG